MAASDAFYNNLLPKIEKVIGQFGTTFTINYAASYDSTTMTTVPAGSRTVNGIVSDDTLSAGAIVTSSLIPQNATNLSWKNKKVLLLPPSANCKANETITVDGKEYALGKVETVKPADVVLLYILELAR